MSEPVGPHAIAVVTRYIVKPGAGEAFDLLTGERRFAAGARSLTVAASAENFLELEGTSSPIGHLEAVTRGTQYQLRGFRERARLLAALMAAQRQLSAVVAVIEASESAAAAGPALMELLGCTTS
jgi:hypothetical protein